MMDRPWRVVLTCCGRDAGVYLAATWEEADAFRNSFTSGEAVAEHGYSADATDWRHQRSGVIESLNDTCAAPPAPDAGGLDDGR
ncbi:MAG: hypothetical protein IPG34_19960 [Rhodocyclaceae bacterium]|nr:hypothetical protein [Rhodocyclaceae bacterium]